MSASETPASDQSPVLTASGRDSCHGRRSGSWLSAPRSRRAYRCAYSSPTRRSDHASPTLPATSAAAFAWLLRDGWRSSFGRTRHAPMAAPVSLAAPGCHAREVLAIARSAHSDLGRARSIPKPPLARVEIAVSLADPTLRILRQIDAPAGPLQNNRFHGRAGIPSMGNRPATRISQRRCSPDPR